MKYSFCAISLLVLLSVVVAGCSDDPVTPTTSDDPSVAVALDPTAADFAVKMDSASFGDRTVRGPFLLRGRDLHYDADAGALVADLTITNSSGTTFRNPVGITFLRLVPEGTIILNAPDGRPHFFFEFSNEDLSWTPGEESLPLRVMFQVDPGVSVGFNAHIDVGGVHEEGLIAGLVWHDANGNGVVDSDEAGLPEVEIALNHGGDEEILRRGVTDRRGRYEFRGLAAGAYEVRVRRAPADMSRTTPAIMYVLLAAAGDGVSRFTAADFGFQKREIRPPGPKLVLGGDHLDHPVVGFRGETTSGMRVRDDAQQLRFRWEGVADEGLSMRAYRWGWNVADPNNPEDPGWDGPPGLDEANFKALWEGPLDAESRRRLVIQCWDSEGHRTRILLDIHIVTDR